MSTGLFIWFALATIKKKTNQSIDKLGTMLYKVVNPMEREADYFDNWTVQVRKGLLELCILNALASATERYGMTWSRRSSTCRAWGCRKGPSTPCSPGLRVQGLVSTRLEESPEGPARKYYALTAKGRRVTALMNEHLDLLTRGARQLREQGGR